MSRPSLRQILAALSPEALSYFFPGFDVMSAEASFKPREDSGIRFKVSTRTDSQTAPKIDLPVKEDLEADIKPCIFEETKSEAGIPSFEAPAREKVTRKSIVRAVMPEPKAMDPEMDGRTLALLEEIHALQKKYGVSMAELESVLSYDVKVSRLRITKRREVILEDFDGREVRMDDLSKSVFFLYLRHPEGIRFKDLPDYRSELEHIYMSITGRGELDDIRRSIDALVNPLSNSINEKVSRIKKAFIDVVDDRVARSYYVDGGRGEAKRIALDRSKVIWD